MRKYCKQFYSCDEANTWVHDNKINVEDYRFAGNDAHIVVYVIYWAE